MFWRLCLSGGGDAGASELVARGRHMQPRAQHARLTRACLSSSAPRPRTTVPCSCTAVVVVVTCRAHLAVLIVNFGLSSWARAVAVNRWWHWSGVHV